MSIVGSAEPRELSRDEIHDAIRRAVGDAAHAMSPTGGFGMNRGIAWRADVAPPHPLAIIDRVRGV
jgi:hypothetical protein